MQAPQPSQPELSPAESSVQNQEGPPPKKDTGPPPPPSTVLEALQQRLEKYQTTCEQAKAEGNGSKARRMGRIAKVKRFHLIRYFHYSTSLKIGR